MRRGLLGLAFLPLVSGCASILAGTSQDIMINSNPASADCTLNREGEIIGRVPVTPGSAKVEKTKHDMTILCKKDGYQNATYMNKSGLQPATWGNIVLGGLIGWGVDSALGADNKYDSPVNLTLVPVTANMAQSQPAIGMEAASAALLNNNAQPSAPTVAAIAPSAAAPTDAIAQAPAAVATTAPASTSGTLGVLKPEAPVVIAPSANASEVKAVTQAAASTDTPAVVVEEATKTQNSSVLSVAPSPVVSQEASEELLKHFKQGETAAVPTSQGGDFFQIPPSTLSN